MKLKRLRYTEIYIARSLYECETWSVLFSEEFCLRMFENKMLRKIFRPRREEETGE
jgi:hypothetical protein